MTATSSSAASIESGEHEHDKSRHRQQKSNKTNKLIGAGVGLLSVVALAVAVPLLLQNKSGSSEEPEEFDPIPKVLDAEITSAVMHGLERHAYLTTVQLNRLIDDTHMRCPDISEVHLVGTSYKGAEIKSIEFSATPGVVDPNKTTVALIGNMHGNEATGREILAWFVSYMCEKRETSALVARILQEVRIIILPSINPDGFAFRLAAAPPDMPGTHMLEWTTGRYAYSRSSDGMDTDLNRDFPATTKAFHDDETRAFNEQYYSSSNFTDNYKQAQSSFETELMQDFFAAHGGFDYALNFHDGSQVVSYPLDYHPYAVKDGYATAPDDKIFREISQVYADEWTDTTTECAQESLADFGGFITNGAHWYSISGVMQDYDYLKYGTLHVTIEVSCIKFPHAFDLEPIIKRNARSILSYLRHISHPDHLPKIYAESSSKQFTHLEFRREGESFYTYTDGDGKFSKILPQKGTWEIYESDTLLSTIQVSQAATSIVL